MKLTEVLNIYDLHSDPNKLNQVSFLNTRIHAIALDRAGNEKPRYGFYRDMDLSLIDFLTQIEGFHRTDLRTIVKNITKYDYESIDSYVNIVEPEFTENYDPERTEFGTIQQFISYGYDKNFKWEYVTAIPGTMLVIFRIQEYNK